MAVDLNQLAAEDAAYAKQSAAQQAQEKAQAEQAKQPPSLLQRFTAPIVHATSSAIDSAVTEAEQWGTAAKRLGQDVAAGGAQAVANTMDTVKSMGSPADPNDPANLPTPIWDHAKNAILDFRDAVAVQDPNIVDRLAQPAAQLAIPFAGYSRALGAIHGFANMVAASAVTDATALGPHDNRLADVIALGRHTEGKLGEVLRTLAPDGGALNAYITYLADKNNESEAEGRFKNVLDGFGANLITAPLIAAAASVLKQGTAGLRYLVNNGVGTASELAPKRPPLVQGGADPLEALAEEQARKDADAAARNPTGKRPPLVQGGADPMEAIAAEQARKDVERAAAAPASEAPRGWETGDTGLERHALDQDSGAMRFRNKLLATSKGPGTPARELIGPLVETLENSPEGKFYADVLRKLQSKRGDVPVLAHDSYYDNTGWQRAPRTYRGQYMPPPAAEGVGQPEAVHMYPAALRSPGQTVQTFTHEMVHAATYSTLENDRFVANAMTAMRTHAKDQFGDLGEAMYGFKNKHEFVAEIESNPDFQRAMKRTPMDDGRSVWDHYKEAIAGILGIGGAVAMSPMFDRLLTKGDNGA